MPGAQLLPRGPELGWALREALGRKWGSGEWEKVSFLFFFSVVCLFLFVFLVFLCFFCLFLLFFLAWVSCFFLCFFRFLCFCRVCSFSFLDVVFVCSFLHGFSGCSFLFYVIILVFDFFFCPSGPVCCMVLGFWCSWCYFVVLL